VQLHHGIAHVKMVFNINKKKGQIIVVAGCEVTDGIFKKGGMVRVLRDKIAIHEGKLESLKHFKEDVNEIRKGEECGMSISDFTDFAIGDHLQAISSRQVPRKFGDPL